MHRNTKHRIRQGIALGCALLALSGCSMFPQEEEALAPPLKQPVEVEYTTEEAVIGNITEEVSDTCTAVATQEYSLSFGERSGVLRSKEVVVGDTVTKGQVIARLDGGDAEAQLEQEKLNLEMLKINLERARAKGLPDTDTQGNQVNFDAQLVELQIKQSELNIQSLEKEIAETTVYAPIDGVVTYLTESNVGDNIPMRDVVCKVADVSSLNFEYTGSKVDKLVFGMDATLTIDGQEYAGKVSATRASVADDLKEEFGNKVRFSVEGAPALELGEKAQYKVVTATRENVVLVPRSAVTGSNGSYYVSIYKDGVRSERAVDVGILTSTQAEIVNGVDAGEQVITN